MYSYLEISCGYGRKRRNVEVFGTFNPTTIFDSTRISNIFDEVGEIESNNGTFSNSSTYTGQPELHPTESTCSPNGNGNPGNSGNSGNSGNPGNSGNQGNPGNSGKTGGNKHRKNRNLNTLKSFLAITGI